MDMFYHIQSLWRILCMLCYGVLEYREYFLAISPLVWGYWATNINYNYNVCQTEETQHTQQSAQVKGADFEVELIW